MAIQSVLCQSECYLKFLQRRHCKQQPSVTGLNRETQLYNKVIEVIITNRKIIG